jgi:DNA repair exonuclease SbcCD ATPase subunit
VASLKVAVEEVREGKKEEVQAIIEAKDKEIELLNSQVARVASDLEMERKDLGEQIDELRQAGQARNFISTPFHFPENIPQETIALYEEKLSEADSKRWELEDLIRELEEKARKQKRSVSPTAVSRVLSEADQIDNEMLREQVIHFERKVSQLEAQLDNVRDTAEKEEQLMRTRIIKYKENDATLKRELLEARSEVETRKRAEIAGKARLEELEEALRENGVALENARAEIEGLRTELGVSSVDYMKHLRKLSSAL